ncbi:hypothetical protein [Mycobacterium sp. SMC-4]|uniref:hypothetical protein n=1 Tax=Mycobacterium sp. SMC-4 TaxID=2857059 RepID=UPI003CFD435F
MSAQNGLVVGALLLLVFAVVLLIYRRNKGRAGRAGIGLSVGEYPSGTAAIDIALGELAIATRFFEKRRNQAKYKAENVLVGTRTANGLIAVIGVLVTFEGWSRWGIVSTALAALVAGIAEWDAHYRHRELWIQRTVVLSKLQNLLRNSRFRLARGDDPDGLAAEILVSLSAILDEDLSNWTTMRGDTEDPPQSPEKDVPPSPNGQ